MGASAYPIHPQQLDSPAIRGFAITGDDANDLTIYTRAIYVGVGGDVKIDMEGGDTGLVLKNAVAGSLLPLRVKRVWSTGTTATNLIGFY